MPTIFEKKEQLLTDTPLLLFDCTLSDGTVEHWSTQPVSLNSTQYAGRILRHNLFEIQTAANQGVDSIPKISIDLANADSHFSELEHNTGFKGAKLAVRVAFFDLKQGSVTTETAILFQGIANPPEAITESSFRLSAFNRLSAQRVFLPKMRVQRRCNWDFPTTPQQRLEAMDGGASGKFSRFYPCGYSPDMGGGVGNLNGSAPFTSCSFTRADCEARGMFNKDVSDRPTARFSGIEFVPATILVRSAGEKGSHLSPVSLNEAQYNDFVPMVYGTAWYSPGIVFSRNDGNLTRMEVLLGAGEITDVYKVIVNNIEIPSGRSGVNMTGTGWFNVISYGTRNGAFNGDFTDGHGRPQGDPYGGMAYLSVVVPNKINDGTSLPSIQVLIDGMKVRQYAADGTLTGEQFSNNPCWIILDILLRNGWSPAEIDLASFATAAAYCDAPIPATDLNGNPTTVSRFQCNLVLQNRRSVGDVLRGIRNSSRLYLTFGFNGLLQLRVENTLALQQPSKPANSNATITLDAGWPAYEFGDGANGTSGILRNSDGSSSVRLWSRAATDCPNRLSVEFQDAFNDYQQDSFSLVDADDVAKTGQEINVTLSALGIPNYDQAARILQFNLSKSIHGNRFVQFDTSVKGLGLSPGDLISLTYLKEGFERQVFRVLKIVPGQNFRTATITAQIHDNAWYANDSGIDITGTRRSPGYGLGVPRPLAGTTLDSNGDLQFGVTETYSQSADGSTTLLANVEFVTPGAIPASAPAIPLISLVAVIANTGGTLPGGTTLYYAVSSVDAQGGESALSFVVRATIPDGPNTNEVTLQNLSFPSAATAFHLYRGPSPSQLFRVASSVPIANTFTDTGLAEQPVLPPDPNFDHSNFYWRLEMQSEAAATTQSPTTVGNSALSMIPNEFQGMTVRITRGTGAGQENTVASNDGTTLTLTTPWTITPDPTSYFVVAQSSYQYGATGKTNRLQFPIPFRPGAIIHISGRSANAANLECSYEISPLTRYRIGGGGIPNVDTDVPPLPTFGLGLSPLQGGTIILSAIGFSDLTNTATITAGTYTFHYYDELAGPPTISLARPTAAADTSLQLNAALPTIIANSYLQLEREVLQVTQVSTDGLTLQVTRGMLDTAAADHVAGVLAYSLANQVVIVPFIKNFFGTPASGSWSFPVSIPNVRLAAAEFYVTNSQGNSPVATGSFTSAIDQGLRTLSGGQYSFQIAGFLAIQTGAAPDISVDAAHAIRDIFAIIKGGSENTGIQLTVNLNHAPMCTLSFDPGALSSNSISGLALPALKAGDLLSLDVTAVGDTIPGNDLTVILRV